MDEEEELSYLAVGLQAVSAFFFVLVAVNIRKVRKGNSTKSTGSIWIIKEPLGSWHSTRTASLLESQALCIFLPFLLNPAFQKSRVCAQLIQKSIIWQFTVSFPPNISCYFINKQPSLWQESTWASSSFNAFSLFLQRTWCWMSTSRGPVVENVGRMSS